MASTERVVLCSGEVVEVFDGDDKKDLREISNWSKAGIIIPVNGKWFMPIEYLKVDKITYNFVFKSTDVFVNGYPKSGTTWMQEIIWTILHNADLNSPIKGENTSIRIPTFEFDSFKGMKSYDWFAATFSRIYDVSVEPHMLDMYLSLPNPRVFKTHFYSSIVNKKIMDVSKMVYIIRDPMDSCYSYYLFHRYMGGSMGFTKDIADYSEAYMRGELFAGNAVEHIKSWWPYRKHKNVYVIFYEAVLKDPAGEIQKLATFLEKDLTKEQLENIVYHTSFKKMKKDFAVNEGEMHEQMEAELTNEQNSFFRKGIVGDSKNLPKEIYNKLAVFFKESFKDLDLPYDFIPQ